MAASSCLDHGDQPLVEIIQMLLGLDAQRGYRIAAHVHRGRRCGCRSLQRQHRRRWRTVAAHIEQLVGAFLQAAIAGLAAASSRRIRVAAIARIAIGIGIGYAEVLR